MANIHQMISLGIGSPSDIPHFVLFGLSLPVSEPTVSVFDTVSLSESSNWLLTLLPDSLSEAVTVTEGVANLLSQATTTTDTVVVSETSARILSSFLAISDSVLSSDSTTFQVSHLASVSSGVALSEAVANLLSTVLAASDSVTVTESTSGQLAFLTSVSSDIVLTESVSNLLSMTSGIFETVTVQETVAQFVGWVADLSETIILTDAAGVTVALAASAFDAVLLADATYSGLESSLTVIDTLTVTDAITEPLTWTIRAGGTVLTGVKVWLSSADPCTPSNLIRGSIQETDAAGQVRYDIDFDRVYFGWREHPQYTFPDPLRFRYSSSNSRWEQWDGSAYVEWTP